MNKSVLILAAFVLCLLLAACGSETSTPAPAQTDGRSADQRTAMRQGLEHSKEVDQQKMPGKLEIGLAVGSLIAMVGVMKYM